jgi:membrane protein
MANLKSVSPTAPARSAVIRFAEDMICRFRDDDVQALGAQLTYYLILAFFPFLIFLLNLIGYMQLSSEQFMAELIRLLPEESGKAVDDIIAEVTRGSSRTLLSFGMIATLWAASNGINAIIKALNKAYDEEENRPFWKVRGISLLSTFVLAFVILIAMLLLVFGRPIGQYLFEHLGYPAGFEFLWSLLKAALPLTAMFGVFMLLYRLTPNRRLRWREVIPGSCFASLGWILTSLLFSYYVNHFGNYEATYGSVGGIIVLLIWLYISSLIILFGGELNASLTFLRDGKVKPTKRPFHFRWPRFLH